MQSIFCVRCFLFKLYLDAPLLGPSNFLSPLLFSTTPGNVEIEIYQLLMNIIVQYSRITKQTSSELQDLIIMVAFEASIEILMSSKCYFGSRRPTPFFCF